MAEEFCTPCDDVIDICINTGPIGPRGSVGKITQFIFYPLLAQLRSQAQTNPALLCRLILTGA